QHTSSISIQIEQVLKKLVLLRVVIPKPKEIRSYLLKNPDLLAILPSLCVDIGRVFDSDVSLSLEHHQDPEFEEDQYLCLYLKIPKLDVAAVDRIDNVAESYSVDFASISGWILIAPDLRRIES